jgi:hypothetical protein
VERLFLQLAETEPEVASSHTMGHYMTERQTFQTQSLSFWEKKYTAWFTLNMDRYKILLPIM